MRNGASDSGGRWWEIRGGSEPPADEGGYRDLVTDTRGRSRPERSLSAGVDPADETGRSARAFLWPGVSAMVAIGLIVSVGYGVSRSRSAPADNTVLADRAVQGSARNEAVAPPNAGTGPAVPSAPLDKTPAADRNAPPLISSGADASRGQAGAPRDPVGIPGSPAPLPGDTATGAAGNTRNPSPETRAPSSAAAPAPAPPVKLKGAAPAAPKRQQGGSPVPGSGGCTEVSGANGFYTCAITQTAPTYLAGATEPNGTMRAEQRAFRCQSDGSAYSVGNRANSWWAWIGIGNFGVWIPVVFLAGGPDNGPEPGLPVCDKAPATSTPPQEPATTKNIVDHKTGRCLDSNDNGNVYTLECNGGDYQKWYSGGDGTIRDKKTGRCLDSNDNGNVYTLECNGGDYQKWDAK
ncbi:MAG: RICIN domain-containing protein [Pseudonocardiaceae bacterium]